MSCARLSESDSPQLNHFSSGKLCGTGTNARAPALQMLYKLHSLVFLGLGVKPLLGGEETSGAPVKSYNIACANG